MVVLRWLLVLPAAIVGGIASTFILHWILLASCTREDSTVQLGKESFVATEMALTGLVVPLAFVYFGSLTAPKYHFHVALILSVLMIVAAFALRAIGAHLVHEPWAWLPLTFNILGPVLGAVAIYFGVKEGEIKTDV